MPLKQNVSKVNIGHVNVSGGVSTTRQWSAYIPVIQGLNYFPFNIESVLLEYSLNTGENADPPFKSLNHEFKMALVSSSSFNLETIRYTYNWDLLSAFVLFAFFLHLLLFPFFCFFFLFWKVWGELQAGSALTDLELKVVIIFIVRRS